MGSDTGNKTIAQKIPWWILTNGLDCARAEQENMGLTREKLLWN
jgi:hypothetical protein